MTDLLLFVSLEEGLIGPLINSYHQPSIDLVEGGRGRGGGTGFTAGPRPAENSFKLPSLVPGWLRPGGRAFPLYTISLSEVIPLACSNLSTPSYAHLRLAASSVRKMQLFILQVKIFKLKFFV